MIVLINNTALIKTNFSYAFNAIIATLNIKVTHIFITKSIITTLNLNNSVGVYVFLTKPPTAKTKILPTTKTSKAKIEKITKNIPLSFFSPSLSFFTLYFALYLIYAPPIPKLNIDK
ncbi:Uncharacterised protein [Catenibacterium mitsuokai]|nr:Uncharacterised protein [Catenibacterium mitsuokai]